MHPLLNKIKKTISTHSLIQPNTHILIGVSGGADSVALLHALLILQIPSDRRTKGQKDRSTHHKNPVNPCELPQAQAISVAHLNHNIRHEAADDAHFVETLCNNLNIPFYTTTVDVPTIATSAGVSLEMAARDARYKFFAEISLQCGADAVATAHNRDDQAETLLLKLCRGAGSAGLDGIAPSTTIQGLRVIRPMLDVSRNEVEDFLKSQNITWREDATNANKKIKRNRIRHDILPQLEKHLNPRIKEALARTASILREDNTYMEQQAAIALKKSEVRSQESEVRGQRSEYKPISVHSCSFVVHPTHPSHLKITTLRTLPKAILRRTLRQWLINAKTPADKMRFDTIERTIELILSKKGTGSITLTANTEITREYDQLHLTNTQTKPTPIPKTELTIPGKTKIESHNLTITATLRKGFERIQANNIGQLPAIATIRWDDKNPPTIQIRSWLPGDRIQPLGMEGSCKLKELFINAKISQSDRPNIPVFICNNEIIWIPGHRISCNFAVTDQKQKSLQLTIAKILI